MMAEPQKEHGWLERLVGEWAYEAEAVMAPGQPPVKSEGTESVRSLGGRWVVGEGRGECPGGGPAHTMLTIGYDPARKRFVGTWVGSMMAHLWVYDGWLDEAGGTLTLEAEGPSFVGEGKMAKYRDVTAFEGADHRVLTSHVQGDDGQWTRFMTAHYRRRRG